MYLNHAAFVVLISAILASCSGKPKPVNCKQYKTGKFRFTGNYNGKPVHFIFERNDATQREISEELNTVANYKVQWKDDCTYQLIFLNGTDNLSREEQDIKRKMVVETTILSGTENYYVFEASNNLYDNVLKDTIWVIK